MDIQIRRNIGQPFRQGGLPEDTAPFGAASSNDDFRNAGKAGEFRDLIGNILSVDRFNDRAELLGKAYIGA